MNDAVLVTGIGVLSPLATSAAELAARVAAGDSALTPLPGWDGALGATFDEIPLDAVPAEARVRSGRLDRLCRLFLAATYLAVDDARLQIDAAAAERVGLVFGTGLGCLLTNAEYNEKLLRGGPAAASPRLFAYTVSSAAAGEVSIALGITGQNVTLHQGMAAGLGAIGYGYDMIRSGKADVVIAAGADALGPALIQGLDSLGELRRDARPAASGAATGWKPVKPAGPASSRSERTPTRMPDRAGGICPSEGAAALVLERAGHARARGAYVWGRITGYAAGFEPTLTHRDRAPVALVETMQCALARSGHRPADVDLVVTSAHQTVIDDTEAAALAAVFSGVPRPEVITPKAAWGECFAAHGALSVALAAARLGNPAGRSEGRHRRLAMVHTLCYSGPTVALLLAHEE